MGYQIRRGGKSPYKSYLKETGLDIMDRDLPDEHKANKGRRKLTNDEDWGGPRLSHVFEDEDENDAHAWVRKNNGHEGQLSVVKAWTTERVEDPRTGGEFKETVDRYLR